MSVVLPLYNGADTLGDQLAALAAQDYHGRWELIVADNGSTDAGLEIVAGWRDRIPHLSVVNAEVRGVSAARNVGVAAAEGEVIALCDADDIVQPSWLSELAECSLRFDMVGGRLDETTLNESWIASVRPPTQDTALPVGLGFLPFSAGANFAVRSSIVRELGGWRECFSGGGDDIDFCWRAQQLGYTIGFAPFAVVAYRHRPTVEALGRQFFHYGVMEVLLYKLHREFGLRRSPVRSGILNLAWVGWHLRDRWGTPVQRGIWYRKAGHRWGRLRGSLRFRTLYL